MSGPLRAAIGQVAYDMVTTVEELLLQRGIDGAAKHWVIAATTEPDLFEPRIPPVTAFDSSAVPASIVASAYAVRYVRCDSPTNVDAAERFAVTLAFVNDDWSEWRSEGPSAVYASYHWLARDGRMRLFDGLRTALPSSVGPGQACEVMVTVESPRVPGDYLLAIDFVKEGVTWFSETGLACQTVPIRGQIADAVSSINGQSSATTPSVRRR